MKSVKVFRSEFCDFHCKLFESASRVLVLGTILRCEQILPVGIWGPTLLSSLPVTGYGCLCLKSLGLQPIRTGLSPDVSTPPP